MNPLISANELSHLINSQKKNFIIADVRGMNKGKKSYLSGHIKGALFFDLEKDLSDLSITPKKGGRHPLPSIEKFYRLLENNGITAKTHIIIYDDSFGALGAARLWWMLKAIGHKNIQLLDGGLQKAIQAGIPIFSTEESNVQQSRYEPKVKTWQLPWVTFEELQSQIGQKDIEIIDVRDAKRFAGIEEKIDPIGGHITSAVNIPYKENLNQDGTFKSILDLQKIYDYSNKNQIIYCGSGVSACHTIFVQYLIQRQIPKLFVGSWSQWCRNFD